jgi:hypothetical protein
MLLYRLLFNLSDDQVTHINGKVILNEEMTQAYNPLLIGLLKEMTKQNPKERVSASEIVSFIEKNAEKINEYNKANGGKKKQINFLINVNEASSKLFKKTSTQFWILKLINENLDTFPKLKYMKLLIAKAWNKRMKISKFYLYLLAKPIHYHSNIALKLLYVLHYYIFYGPNQAITTVNLIDFLNFFKETWASRCSNFENFDRDDPLKNSQICNFIITYCEFVKLKITYHKKYNYIDLNYSIENLKNNFDFSLLIEKKFITDTLSLYSQACQKFMQIPITVASISKTLDVIIQNFNEEIISLFNFIFYLLVAYKYYHGSEKNEGGKIFDSQFFEITNKAKEYLEKFRKFRNEINSKNIFYNFPANYTEYLGNLDMNLKHFGNDFNINNFFEETKEVNGIRLNKNVGKLFENSNNNNNSVNNNSNAKVSRTESFHHHKRETSINLRKSKGFEFSDDKFANSKTNFDFSVSQQVNPKRSSTPNVKLHPSADFGSKILTTDFQENSVKKILIEDNIKPNTSINPTPMFNFNNISNAPNITFNFTQAPNNYMPTYINNASSIRPPSIPRPDKAVRTSSQNAQSLFNNNFFSKSNNKDNFASEEKEQRVNTLTNDKVIDILNGIFDTNDKGNNLRPKSNSNDNFEKEIYDSDKVQEMLKEIDYSVQNNFKNQQQSNFGNFYPNNCRTPSFDSNLPNKSLVMNSSFTQPGFSANNNVFNNNNTNTNNFNDFLGYNQTQHNKDYSMQLGTKQPLNQGSSNNLGGLMSGMNISNTANNNMLNNNVGMGLNNNLNTNYNNTQIGTGIDNNKQVVDTNDSEYFESINSNFNNPNINIITIQNHYNNFGIDNKPVESVANSFLLKEFSKGNLHWLISSKDIELGKQIGFGGSSEVYVANYRGTEVAVKKLRILEVKDENLKEFKREVSSLVMLRHPNLVLFMGAT